MKKTAVALMLISALVFSTVIAALFVRWATQTPLAITINPDGSVRGTSLIQRQGDTYTLLNELSRTIYVQRSDIVIDGAGNTVKGNGEGIGIDLTNECWRDSSRAQIRNVTVRNLKLANWSYAIEFVASANDTFVGNYVVDCYIGFNIWWTHNHTLRRNTIKNCVTGITISFGGGGNILTENNFLNSSVFVMEQSPDNTFDRNYWSDYLTKYPSAEEIDNSGIWNMPYEGHEAFIDNQPLIEPVPLNPEFANEERFQVLLIVAVTVTIVALVAVGLLIYFRKRQKRCRFTQ